MSREACRPMETSDAELSSRTVLPVAGPFSTTRENEVTGSALARIDCLPPFPGQHAAPRKREAEEVRARPFSVTFLLTYNRRALNTTLAPRNLARGSRAGDRLVRRKDATA